jgi:hypothetical protein
MAGNVDAAARTAAIAILTTNLMEGPRKYRPKKKLARIVQSGQGTADWMPSLAARAKGGDALIRRPHAARQFSGLPEHIDRHAAARMKIAADTKPFGP